MHHAMKSVAGALTVCLLTACATNSNLRREIAVIEARVQSVEGEIASATAEIGAPGKDVRTQLSYRPLVAWADAFSARPTRERMIRFRQVSRGGDIYNERHVCRLEGWSWIRKDGKRAWIHESDSTKIDLEIGRFAVVPQDDGLVLLTRLELDAKTQVGANYRPACLGGSVGTNIGVTAEASSNAVMRVQLLQTEGEMPRYRLAVISPHTIGLEMRAHFQWFRVGWTIPFDNLTRDLAKGELDLLLAREGQILLPGGAAKTYRLATVAPTLTTSNAGIALDTDLSIEIE
jgi:hypothetical protein